MKIIGAEEGLTTGSTRGKSHTAHYVFNNGSKQSVTIRNVADDGDTGSVRINANAGVVIHTDVGVWISWCYITVYHTSSVSGVLI